MARGERLMQLADLLRGRAETTIEALADELGVSRRTVIRDLSALRERGMSISGDVGPGGGIRLDRDRGLAAVHLTLSEIVSIWLAARLSRAVSDLPWGESTQSGMAKLLASLPHDKARALRALARRVLVGQPASNAVRATVGEMPQELLRLFEEAFSSGLGLAFTYRDRDGRLSNRRVEPHGLLVEPPVWYILARDVDLAAARTFRMDRISRPRVLSQIVFRPDVEVIRAALPESDRWKPLTGA